MRLKIPKRLFLFTALLSSALALVALGMDFYSEHERDKTHEMQVARIFEHTNIDKTADFHTQLDALRVFINSNSQHLEDEEFFSRWEDQTLIAQAFLDYLEGKRIDLPHMECSTRRGFMAAILRQELGYKTRAVDLYTKRKNNTLISHSAFDV